MLAGSRDILLIAPAATLLGIVLGTMLGLITGYLRGVVDDVVSRFVDAVLSLPAHRDRDPHRHRGRQLGARGSIVLIIGLIFAPVVSRTVRAAVLAEAELDYVQAARLRGERAPYIMSREILPNVMSPVVVEFTVRLGYAIFAVATLDVPRLRRPAAVAGLGGADQPVLDADRPRTGG